MHITGLAKVNLEISFRGFFCQVLWCFFRKQQVLLVSVVCCSASTYTILVFGLSQNYEHFLMPIFLGM